MRIGSNAIRTRPVGFRMADGHNWSLGSPNFASMNTTHSNAGTADQFGWVQSPPYFRDKNGNDITGMQWNTGTVTNGFTYRNSGGAWTDASVGETSLTHGAFAYDAANNLIHANWYSANLGDANGNIGYVYRRYVIQYSGNNITDIVSDNGINIGGSSTRTNLVLDAQGTSVPSSLGEQPDILLLPNGTYGTLVFTMPWQNVNGCELRVTMVAMGASSSAGKSAVNYANPLGGATAVTAIGGSAPYVAFGKAFVNVAASQLIPYGSLSLKANGANVGDLCFPYAKSTAGTLSYNFVRMRWNSGSSNWSNGLSTPVSITNIQRAGTDAGYSLKYQLLTNPVEDAAGNLYVGMATWKDNANGDTWSYAKIANSVETVTIVDAYSAAGAHSYAPTGHLGYDPVRALLVISYIKTTTQFAFGQAFNANTGTQKIAEFTIFNADKVDIPYFLNGNPSIANTIPMVLRNTVATFKGFSGTVNWS